MKAVALVLLAAGAAHADPVVEGEPSAHELTVTPGSGTTIGPIRIELSSKTLTLPRTRYRRKHAADPEAVALRFELRFTAPTAGDHELAIELRYWQCGRKVCRPMRSTTVVNVHADAKTPVAPSSP